MLLLTKYFRWITGCWVHHAYWSSHWIVWLGDMRTTGLTRLPVYSQLSLQEARRMFIKSTERFCREIGSINLILHCVPKYCRLGHLFLLDLSAVDENIKRRLSLGLQPVRLFKLVSAIVNHYVAIIDDRFRLSMLYLLRPLLVQNCTWVSSTSKRCLKSTQRCN